MMTDKAHDKSSAEITPTMACDPNKPDRTHDKDLEDDKALSGHHFTIQSNAASNVPPIHDPLIAGVAKISAFRQVYSSKRLVWSFWIAFAVWAVAIALSQDTTFVYLAFATSSFATNSLLSTIALLCSIVTGVINPFWAKLADLSARSYCLLASVMLYAIGYACSAGAPNMETLAAGQVIYTIGNSGLGFLQTLIVSDITSLQYRGLVLGGISLVYVPFAFVTGDITTAVGLTNWRWGYGMFCIIMPVCLTPILIALFWADHKAKGISKVALEDSTEPQLAPPSVVRRILRFFLVIDAFGLILLGTTFALLLSPPTLVYAADNGWKNPSMIAMIVVGGCLLPVFCAWEWFGAKYPIMPRSMWNKTFLISVFINFVNFLVSTLHNTYWNSWVWVIQDYNTRNYTYMTQIETVTLCTFAIIGGAIQRYTHRYKYLQIFALCLRILGAGITYYSSLGNSNTVCLFFGKFLITVGNSWSIIGSAVAAHASVKHKDLGIAIAVLSLWSSIGESIGSTIAGAIWPYRLIDYLTQTTQLDPLNIATVAGDIYSARFEGLDPAPGVREAYNFSYKRLCLIALPLTFIPLFAAFFSEDYVLDDRHNTMEDEKHLHADGQADKNSDSETAEGRQHREDKV